MAGTNSRKKLWAAVSVGALVVGGLTTTSAGDLDAAKAVPTGTLHCNTSGTITFTPSALLQVSQLPNGQDQKLKATTNTTLSGCTGSEPTSGLPVPAGGTSISKMKSKTRFCTSLTNFGNKTKYVFSGGAKSKLRSAQGTTLMKADNNTPLVLTDDVTIPPTTAPGFSAFFNAHNLDNIVIATVGSVLAGKAYKGRSLQTINRAAKILNWISVCNAPTGLVTMQIIGAIGIGVPA